ncbi:protein-tyrosine phosphatase family protein [Parashewanella curva]|nr:protein-tyrosine phosphatase family protein [Parashewanella curva]
MQPETLSHQQLQPSYRLSGQSLAHPEQSPEVYLSSSLPSAQLSQSFVASPAQPSEQHSRFSTFLSTPAAQGYPKAVHLGYCFIPPPMSESDVEPKQREDTNTTQHCRARVRLIRPAYPLFTDILIAEHTSVPIKTFRSSAAEKGLISANYVNVPNFGRIIASEHPSTTKEPFELFWKMVMQTNTQIIWDLSGTPDTKIPYYPDGNGQKILMGSITVTKIETGVYFHNYEIEDSRRSRHYVNRYCLNDWADGQSYPLDKFNVLLDNINNCLPECPHMLIHCMGGIGRTGVVLVALSLLEYRDKLIELPQTIEKLVDSKITLIRFERSPRIVERLSQRQMLIDLIEEWQEKVRIRSSYV